MNPDSVFEWIVLSKAPVPGTVKTRLIPALGEARATRLYEQLLERLRKTLEAMCSSAIHQNSRHVVAVWYAGDPEHPAFSAWKSIADFYPQPDQADLGERMAVAVKSALSRNRIPVLVGADVPALDEIYLKSAAESLQAHDVVISPAEDGGYGLLGLRKFIPSLFSDKEWGTETVYRNTEKNLNQEQISWASLPVVWDVDEPEDVERFLNSD